MIDLTYLHSISDGDKDVEKALIGIFLEQLPEFEKDLTNAFAQKDFATLAANAHKAKSSIQAMGMEDLAKQLKRLEMLCKQLFVNQALSNNTDDKRIEDYQRQLSSLPDDLKTWIDERFSKKDMLNAIEDTIIFYKLQAEFAKNELTKGL
ncbi:MAG: Hpt domain-containing protein [Bacteroidales bacterium]|nr:Hpt domain-containing protein [Bacteroidales bacterium]